jgi:1-pyrroline-5-carboxylate dehydrogenase
MNNILPSIPPPVNEPIRSYRPGSPERASLQHMLRDLRSQEIDIPAFIGGREIRTGNLMDVIVPHDRHHKLGTLHLCSQKEVNDAIAAARDARGEWARMHWTDRAAIFLKAAELLAGPWRDVMNASTMLGQSKTAYQAEIDAACELIDFFRFNVHYMRQIYEDQPLSPTGVWNQVQYRGLEGFVFAVTPFNFTSIQGNLPTAPALMGNTVLWKPSSTGAFPAYFIYKLLEEAGLPPGVINFVPGNGADVGDPVLASEDFGGLHFTGSTGVFQTLWKGIGSNIAQYRSYPRIVGETGGKDFIVAHGSSDPIEVATAIVRGAFEYQGQKCSAASRVYVAKSIWDQVQETMLAQLEEIKMGPAEDFTNFVNAVIDAKAYKSITEYITRAKEDGVKVIAGGTFSDDEGFFIAPTVLLVDDPGYRTMCEEIFGPVVSVFVFDDDRFDETLRLVNRTSPYALTGAVFARDRRVIVQATEALEEAAGNFYINDKPTGAVVGQQPFGGGRASGTNDKAGSYLNLVRWVSARSIKETFVPAKDYTYPFLADDDAVAGDGAR